MLVFAIAPKGETAPTAKQKYSFRDFLGLVRFACRHNVFFCRSRHKYGTDWKRYVYYRIPSTTLGYRGLSIFVKRHCKPIKDVGPHR